MPTGPKPNVSFATLSRAVLLITSPTLIILVSMLIVGALNANEFLFGYLSVLFVTTLLLRPFFANTNILTRYVRDLAEDKQVKEPNFGFLSGVGELSTALIKLHRSWEKRRMQMSNDYRT